MQVNWLERLSNFWAAGMKHVWKKFTKLVQYFRIFFKHFDNTFSQICNAQLQFD